MNLRQFAVNLFWRHRASFRGQLPTTWGTVKKVLIYFFGPKRHVTDVCHYHSSLARHILFRVSSVRNARTSNDEWNRYQTIRMERIVMRGHIAHPRLFDFLQISGTEFLIPFFALQLTEKRKTLLVRCNGAQQIPTSYATRIVWEYAIFFAFILFKFHWRA